MSAIYLADDIVEIREEQLATLRVQAEQSPLRRSRFCLHRGNDDTVHEMVIGFMQDSYIRPHRHRDKSESFHVIAGELAVVFFGDDGRETRRLRLGAPGSGLPFLYRLSAPVWHTVVPLTEFCVIHEVTAGPFVPGDADVAPWSVDPSDAEGVRAFLDSLERPAPAGVA